MAFPLYHSLTKNEAPNDEMIPAPVFYTDNKIFKWMINIKRLINLVLTIINFFCILRHNIINKVLDLMVTKVMNPIREGRSWIINKDSLVN